MTSPDAAILSLSPTAPRSDRDWEGRKTLANHPGGNGSGNGSGTGNSSGGGSGSSSSINTYKRQNPSHSPLHRNRPLSDRREALSNGSSSAASTAANSSTSGQHHHARPRRLAKIKHRASTAKHEHQTMEPPVLSFYGTEPVPLPSRFSHLKRNLVAGHEAELEASWTRLLDALRDDVSHIRDLGPNLTPSIDFSHIDDPSKADSFASDLKRYGLGVVRGVMPKADADVCIAETVRYLETKHDFKPPPAQDPTCFDFYWTPAQVRTRAHPNVLRAQRFAMSLWNTHNGDGLATRFPLSYADRLRIHGATVGDGVAGDGTKRDGPVLTADASSTSAAAASAAAASATAIEQLGDFDSSAVIAQVDSGSLERWEPDGYGRGGTYDAVFRGQWESYDPWDPAGRVGTTPDLYNGYGACSIFRMYQGVVSLNNVEPGMIRLLPSPKLATAYFLLRPFFSPKTKAPENQRDGPEWEAFLDPSNWALDHEQNTIIHGAVPGHAQRLTELWHPHLHLRQTLITIPTLQPGDYVLWHPDLAYHITSNGSIAASRAATPPSNGPTSPQNNNVSILVYIPAAPLTQTNALYLARQRKTFLRGHSSPDFDATGSGLGSEASHTGRPGEDDIAKVGGSAGLQAMGLAPFDVAPTPPSDEGETGGSSKGGTGEGGGAMDVDASGAAGAPAGLAEVEVARLANIILFPEQYDMYMARKDRSAKSRIKKEME